MEARFGLLDTVGVLVPGFVGLLLAYAVLLPTLGVDPPGFPHDSLLLPVAALAAAFLLGLVLTTIAGTLLTQEFLPAQALLGERLSHPVSSRIVSLLVRQGLIGPFRGPESARQWNDAHGLCLAVLRVAGLSAKADSLLARRTLCLGMVTAATLAPIVAMANMGMAILALLQIHLFGRATIQFTPEGMLASFFAALLAIPVTWVFQRQLVDTLQELAETVFLDYWALHVSPARS